MSLVVVPVINLCGLLDKVKDGNQRNGVELHTSYCKPHLETFMVYCNVSDFKL